MKLHYRKYGSGQPLIILHGLFGHSDNWNTLAKQFAESGFEVYAVDLRNHGLSPHSAEWTYALMTADLNELVDELKLEHAILLGQSMGGLVCMQFAVTHPDKVDKLIVVDMAPKKYPPHHAHVIAGLQSIDFSVVKTRKEAEEKLSEFIKDNPTRQFLLKNLYWINDNTLAWRFNLASIAANYHRLAEFFNTETSRYPGPTWFIRGGKSDYVLDGDWPMIQRVFPDSTLITIPDAHHWVHAEQPKIFYDAVMEIIGK
jgi:pimeloyl-ACP methyl ester carboxylesterase